MDYSTFLSHFATFGWFNGVLLFITCLAGASTMSLNLILINYLGTRTDHWCFVPELVNRSLEDQMSLGIPWDRHTDAYATCSMYTHPLAEIGNDSWVNWPVETPEEMSCLYGMVHDTSVRASTYISEWDVVCGDAWLTEVVSPMYIAGQFLGGLASGPLSNRLGRKRTLVLVLLCNTAASALAAFSVNFYMFLAMRLLVAACGVNSLTLSYVLTLEITPSQYREVANITCAVMYDVGILMASGLALLITDWRALQLAAGVVCVPCLILLMILVPESPRWLTWQDRHREAADVLARIARINGAPQPPPGVVQEFSDGKKSEEPPAPGATTEGSYRELFVNPVTRRCVLTIVFAWTTTSFIFCGVSYNVDKLFGNIYLNTSVLALVAVAANVVTWVAIKCTGRRISLMVILAAAFLMGIIGAIAEELEGWEEVVTISAIVLRSLASSGCMIGYIVMLELFPTPIRNLVLSMATAIVSVVTIGAPFTAGTLTDFWRPIPYVIYVIMCGVSLVLVTWLPETRGKQMPETIPELEAMKSSTDRPTGKATHPSTTSLSGFTEKGHSNHAFQDLLEYSSEGPFTHTNGVVLHIPPQANFPDIQQFTMPPNVLPSTEDFPDSHNSARIVRGMGSSGNLGLVNSGIGQGPSLYHVHLPHSACFQCNAESYFPQHLSPPNCTHPISFIGNGYESVSAVRKSMLGEVMVYDIANEDFFTRM